MGLRRLELPRHPLCCCLGRVRDCCLGFLGRVCRGCHCLAWMCLWFAHKQRDIYGPFWCRAAVVITSLVFLKLFGFLLAIGPTSHIYWMAPANYSLVPIVLTDGNHTLSSPGGSVIAFFY